MQISEKVGEISIYNYQLNINFILKKNLNLKVVESCLQIYFLKFWRNSSNQFNILV